MTLPVPPMSVETLLERIESIISSKVDSAKCDNAKTVLDMKKKEMEHKLFEWNQVIEMVEEEKNTIEAMKNEMESNRLELPQETRQRYWEKIEKFHNSATVNASQLQTFERNYSISMNEYNEALKEYNDLNEKRKSSNILIVNQILSITKAFTQ